MHFVSMDKSDLLRRVQARMAEEGLDQGRLAARIHTTQGHLSKILRGHFQRRSRVLLELEAFAAGASFSRAQTELLGVCYRIGAQSPEALKNVSELMHLVEDICIHNGKARPRGSPRR
jgi:transcriptional regulator with XRE-family HTH domain